MSMRRWTRAVITRKKIDFKRTAVYYDGLPHVATLQDGTNVYSRMPVRRSTSEEVVFRNGSQIKFTPGNFSMDVAGGRVVVLRPDGNVISSGGDDPSGDSSSRVGIG